MLEPIHPPMSVEAFFAWQERQAERYELVGGVPVRMRAGARDDIGVNPLAALHTVLPGSVETLPGQIRRLDGDARDPGVRQAADRAWHRARVSGCDGVTFPSRPRLVQDEPPGETER